MRMRKKPNLPARLERCAAVLTASPETCRGRWLESAAGCGSLYLEIGCGKGRFITETAKASPEALFIGIERVPEAMVIAMERTLDGGIPNIRFIHTDAVRLPELFAGGEVGRIYLNFCDPWPKKGHAKRRLTHENFLKLYKEILEPGGQIHFKTDNGGLFDYSLGQFEACGFELAEVTRGLHRNGPNGVMTDYELRFYEQGVSINRCVARLKA
jgi:tRNA (guanine-N7-)-methyltransferase